MTVFHLAWCLVLLSWMNTRLQAESVRVYAAVSLIGSMKQIERIFEKENNVEIRFSFGASSTLARQIEWGAPAEVYFSANPVWMDYLDSRGLIHPDSRIDLLGNTLVVVAPRGARPPGMVGGSERTDGHRSGCAFGACICGTGCLRGRRCVCDRRGLKRPGGSAGRVSGRDT